MIREWRMAAAMMVGLLAGCGGSARPSETAAAQPLPRHSLGAFESRWVDASGRPSRDAREALALLAAAADEGLDPADYQTATLEGLARGLDDNQEPLAAEVEAFGAALNDSLLRYLRHVHLGRIEPRTIGFQLTPHAHGHDFAAMLDEALAAHRITQRAAELAPPLALYRDLRRVLARYRSLSADTFGLLPPPGAAVHPGEPYAGLRELYRRLVAFGDLPPDVPQPPHDSAYGGAMVEGVKHFQMRHGLESDGVLGRGTHAALRVPPSWRVRQIELALERLRWLPDSQAERLIVVNIAMFRLWAWDAVPPGTAPSVSTGVIVGRAVNTRTPVFDEEMRYIIFRPYWNIPTSILRDETLPALLRDPGYLDRNDMEIVSGQGDNATPVALTERSLAGLRNGALRVRQRPGPKNSLGLIKFVFPSDANVYLHGTPAQQLFSRPRRDFSHGCVRVEDPVALAEWALNDQPEWTRDRILAAMNGKESRRVSLTRPIEVILFYVTAAVMPEDGTVRFAEDIYGHDARLDQALTRERLSEWPD